MPKKKKKKKMSTKIYEISSSDFHLIKFSTSRILKVKEPYVVCEPQFGRPRSMLCLNVASLIL